MILNQDITLTLNENEAKEILNSIAIRYNQNGLDKQTQSNIRSLGQRISNKFEYSFKFKDGAGKPMKNIFDYLIHQIKSVKVKQK